MCGRRRVCGSDSLLGWLSWKTCSRFSLLIEIIEKTRSNHPVSQLPVARADNTPVARAETALRVFLFSKSFTPKREKTKRRVRD